MTPDPTCPAPGVSVVVPTFQRRASLAVTLDRLAAQHLDADVEIIVVDNGSTDGTEQELARRAAAEPRVRVHRIEHNRGPGPARNAGWRLARAPIVAFTDDDTQPGPGWLAHLTAPFADGADLVMGPTVPDPAAVAGTFSHCVRAAAPMPWFPTCNIAYRRELLAQLGGFDPAFTARVGASFGDDTDLGWKALEAGAEARFAPGALVHHEVTASDLGDYLRSARRRRGVPAVVAAHPGLRAQLPLPWLYVEAHGRATAMVVGLVAVALAPRRRLAWAAAALLARPYLAFRAMGPDRPDRRAHTPWALAGHFAHDLCEIAVVARHAAREKIVLW